MSFINENIEFFVTFYTLFKNLYKIMDKQNKFNAKLI